MYKIEKIDRFHSWVYIISEIGNEEGPLGNVVFKKSDPEVEKKMKDWEKAVQYLNEEDSKNGRNT